MNDASFVGLFQNAILLLGVAFMFDVAASRWRIGKALLWQALIGVALGAVVGPELHVVEQHRRCLPPAFPGYSLTTPGYIARRRQALNPFSAAGEVLFTRPARCPRPCISPLQNGAWPNPRLAVPVR